jgi:hypothetical protein
MRPLEVLFIEPFAAYGFMRTALIGPSVRCCWRGG